MAGTVRERNMLAQVGLMIITFGIYAIYWFYSTADEIKTAMNNQEASPGLWTVCMFIPIANLWAIYKYSEQYEGFSSDKMSRWILFVLWIVFSPAVWFVVQTELNKRARGV